METKLRISVHVIDIQGTPYLTPECLESLPKDVIIEVTQPSVPLLEARLRFIETCGTELLTFVDYDDSLPDGALAAMLLTYDNALAQGLTLSGVTGNEVYVDDEGKPIIKFIASNAAFDVGKALQAFHVARPVVIRTEVAQEVARFLRAQDPAVLANIYVDFVIAFLSGCLLPYAYHEGETYLYRQHPKNMTKSAPHSWMQAATTKLLIFVLQHFGKDYHATAPKNDA